MWSDNQWVGPALATESKNTAIPMETIKVEAVKKKSSESDTNKQSVKVQTRTDVSLDTWIAKPRDAVAIVIGIQNYQRLPVASFAANDAAQFRDHAVRYLGVQPSHINMLLDANAQRADILLALKYWLPAHVNPGSTDVFVFFSGHGMGRESGKPYYWLPHDVNTDLLEDTAISLKSFMALLSRSAAKSVTVFADSCYSGSNRQGQALVQHQKGVTIKRNPDNLPAGMNMLAATSSSQTAYGDETLQHGIFSFYLLQGLAGASDANQDRQINLGELADFVTRQTSRHALNLHKQQDPQFSGDRQQVVSFP